MVSVEIAEVSCLTVEVYYVREIYRIAHQSSSVHEVVSYFITS